METNVVYVLVSDENDLYLQQAIISMYSLRIHNPSVKIILVTDDVTNSTLKGDRKKILDYISERIIVSRPNGYNKKDSSRFLKTTLRTRIAGRFLFLDTDTIICDDISTIGSFDSPIGAVLDKHIPLNQHPSRETIESWARLADWEINGDERYYNSGVMLVSDTKEVHNFYEKWHEAWLDSRNNGLNQDQPALGKVNQQFNLIRELDGIWNCQITDNGLRYLHKSKIIHYFASMQKWDTPYEIPYYFREKDVFFELRDNNNIISEQIYKHIINAKSGFKEVCLIQTGRNVEIQYTIVYRVLKKIYFNYPNIYLIFNKTLSLISQIRTRYATIKNSVCHRSRNN